MAIIKFYGDFKQYGDKFKINTDTAAEAMNCLYTQIKGLKNDVLNGRFRIRINKTDINDDNLKFGLHTKIPQDAVIHIIPVVAGAKSSGLFQIVLGAALFTVGFFAPVTWGAWGTALMAAGGGLMLGGVAQMLTKMPTTKTSSESTNKSTSFSSLGNTIAQGAPIPLIYGQIMVGSKVLSQGIETMDTE